MKAVKATVHASALAVVVAAVVGLGLALALSPTETPAGTLSPALAQGGLAAPANVRAADGATSGTAVVSWDAVAGAAFYRIGWAASDDIAAVRADGRNWLDAFDFKDVENKGQNLADAERSDARRPLRFYCRRRSPSLWQRAALVGMDLSDYGGSAYANADADKWASTPSGTPTGGTSAPRASTRCRSTWDLMCRRSGPNPAPVPVIPAQAALRHHSDGGANGCEYPASPPAAPSRWQCAGCCPGAAR